MEITYNASKPETDKETAEQIRLLSETYKDKMIIGAGTVLTKKQVQLTKKAGGKFIISQNVNKSVIKKTSVLRMVSIPGALTCSECADAHRFGADFIKLFSLSTMGASYLKAVKAPLSHLRFLAVGGISMQNVTDYLQAGACGFGIGAQLVNQERIHKGDFAEITKSTKELVEKVKNFK